jgi:hypothetical protein
MNTFNRVLEGTLRFVEGQGLVRNLRRVGQGLVRNLRRAGKVDGTGPKCEGELLIC